jgi:hypothetical protein
MTAIAITIAISSMLLAACNTTTNPYTAQIARLDASRGSMSDKEYWEKRDELEGKEAEYNLESTQTAASVATAGASIVTAIAGVNAMNSMKHHRGRGPRPAPRGARPPRPPR